MLDKLSRQVYTCPEQNPPSPVGLTESPSQSRQLAIMDGIDVWRFSSRWGLLTRAL